ncbi:MAG: hypothetical protein AAF721_09405 [Myxococcota bacterium]
MRCYAVALTLGVASACAVDNPAFGDGGVSTGAGAGSEGPKAATSSGPPETTGQGDAPPADGDPADPDTGEPGVDDGDTDPGAPADPNDSTGTVVDSTGREVCSMAAPQTFVLDVVADTFVTDNEGCAGSCSDTAYTGVSTSTIFRVGASGAIMLLEFSTLGVPALEPGYAAVMHVPFTGGAVSYMTSVEVRLFSSPSLWSDGLGGSTPGIVDGAPTWNRAEHPDTLWLDEGKVPQNSFANLLTDVPDLVEPIEVMGFPETVELPLNGSPAITGAIDDALTDDTPLRLTLSQNSIEVWFVRARESKEEPVHIELIGCPAE